MTTTFTSIFKKDNYDHPHYKIVEDPKEADAEGWIYLNSSKFTKLPFKFETLKPNEIRANVLYTGLCHTDPAVGTGVLRTPSYPICLGHEIVCQVSMMGSEVKGFQVGEIVGFGVVRNSCKKCKYCLKQKELLCTEMPIEEKQTFGNYWGGWATHIQHPADFFFKLPDGTDIKKAPSAFCAGATVYGPIKEFAKSGDKCLVIGVGGLGHLAIKFLAKLGFEVAALTHHKDKASDCIRFGASKVLLLDDKDQLENYKDYFNFIINTQPTFKFVEETLQLAAPEGKYVMVGIGGENEKLEVTQKNWIIKDVLLIGSVCGGTKIAQDTLQFMADNNIWPEIEEFSFDNFEKAVDKLQDQEAYYRIIVNVADYAKQHGWLNIQ